MDPGHNGGNFAAASVIGKLHRIGRETESCNTTGAQTDGGYTEAQFNWNVAVYLTADLRERYGVGRLPAPATPGWDRASPSAPRSATRSTPTRPSPSMLMGGRPAGGASPSCSWSPTGATMRHPGLLREPRRHPVRPRSPAGPGAVQRYARTGGIQTRDDLAPINLSTVPKAFIECANMRNATDAALVMSVRWQATAARRDRRRAHRLPHQGRVIIEEGEDGQHPPVVRVGRRKSELAEDAAVCFSTARSET